MSSILERMRDAQRNPSVILIKYNQKRSSHPEKIFLAVEGAEDIAYYENAIDRIVGPAAMPYHFFVCGGKDFVLDLMFHLDRNVQPDAKNAVFFIDHDFDGHKGFGGRETLYVTEGYSIENSIANRSTLNKLLQSEFRCALEGHEVEADLAAAAFTSVMEAYASHFSMINRCIHAARVTQAFKVSTDKSIKEKLWIGPDGLDFAVKDISDAKDFLSIDLSLAKLSMIIEGTYPEFLKLDPYLAWRGKYIYHVFCEFLAVLAEDRGRRKNRQIFSTRAAITFRRDTASIRLLASASEVPGPLKNFLQKYLALPNVA